MKADNARVIGWQRVRENLAIAPDGKPYVQVFNTCLKLIETIPLMIYDDKNVEDVGDNLPDHWCEMFRYGLMSRPAPSRMKMPKENIWYDDPFDLNKKRRVKHGR